MYDVSIAKYTITQKLKPGWTPLITYGLKWNGRILQEVMKNVRSQQTIYIA